MKYLIALFVFFLAWFMAKVLIKCFSLIPSPLPNTEWFLIRTLFFGAIFYTLFVNAIRFILALLYFAFFIWAFKALWFFTKIHSHSV